MKHLQMRCALSRKRMPYSGPSDIPPDIEAQGVLVEKLAY